jgi:hypothetical protein
MAGDTRSLISPSVNKLRPALGVFNVSYSRSKFILVALVAGASLPKILLILF